MRRVSVQEAMKCDGRLIDVRGVDEFAGERLGRAECVPLDRLAAEASGWDRGGSLILMCRSGVRSAQAAETLERMGFTNLLMLEGGIEACKKAGVEVIRDRK
ncbi:MAG TPA: rhodanese-like domain-containing protein, partial [Phycisphaerae bacterium]|nr:rhodanese-like domain-containing protein [Phycisphaerae bacterium]